MKNIHYKFGASGKRKWDVKGSTFILHANFNKKKWSTYDFFLLHNKLGIFTSWDVGTSDYLSV